MVVFPNAKINIGLNVTEKRTDGYHNLETVFYPIKLSDVLEFVRSDTPTRIIVTGIEGGIPVDDNIVMKALDLIGERYPLPDLEIYLHKIIPSGAGLGGGSSDASFMMKALNDYFALHVPDIELLELAGKLGSDCPFFIKNKALFAQDKGTIFTPVDLDLSAYKIMIVKPEIHIPTKLAFQNIETRLPDYSLKDLIKLPPEEWKNVMVNDFEPSIFKQYPEIQVIKEKLYEQGAVYAQMSGSGSAVYALFKDKPEIPDAFKEHFVYIQR